MSDADRGKVRFVTVGAEHDGQRVDNYLMRELKGVPRAWVYRVLRKGEVRVNKGRVKPDSRLATGDQLRIPPVRQASRDTVVGAKEAENIEKTILYEDKLLLVVNKPHGLAVHGGSGISSGVIERLRAARPDAPYLELAHRLDRDTSGCLLLAKRRSALKTFQELQARGKVVKRYLALLAGKVRRDTFRVDVPLRKNTLHGGERVVRVDAGGKAAATRFRVLRRFAGATLVEAVLETGRTHQIRVHAAHAAHPILGDAKYGDMEENTAMRGHGLKRLFLHAAALEMPWPESGVRHCFEAPLPDDLSRVLTDLGGG